MGLAAFNRMRRAQAQQAILHEGESVIPLTNDSRAYTDYTAQEVIDMNAKEQKAFIEKHELTIDGYKSLKAPELEQALLDFLGFAEKDETDADAVVTTTDVDAGTSDAE